MKLTLTDRLWLALCAVGIVLLAFGALMGVSPQTGQESETATPVQTPPSCIDAVALAAAPKATPTPEPAPEPTTTPEPSPTHEPDKPVYDPAIPLPEDLQLILWEACEENGVDSALALGVIEVESRFVVDIVNPITGCYGLMQLNPSYFPADLPPGENIRAGVEYLGQLLARYGTVEAALTSYNAGHDTGDRGYAVAVLAAAERWRDARQ